MELQQINIEKNLMQHNAITSGRYDFSACQLDIMFMLLALLEKDDPVLKEYVVSVMDIELITGRKWNYQQLRESTEGLGSRMFEIETLKSLKQIWLFSKVEYYDGTGTFGVKINPEARPYFFDLKGNFTVLQLGSVLSCTSKYAKRLYALACQLKNKKQQPPMLISELKEMLGLKDPKGKTKEQYVEITAFKKKVLDIAKKQINENTDITFDYKLHKRGRYFDKISIYPTVSIPNQIQIDFNVDLEHQKKSATIQASGINGTMAELWAKKYWKEFLEEKKTMLEDIKKGKDVKDFPAYLVGVFKKKGYL